MKTTGIRPDGFYFIRIDQEWTIGYYYGETDNWCLPTEDSYGRYTDNDFSEVGAKIKIKQFSTDIKKLSDSYDFLYDFVEKVRIKFDISPLGFESRQAHVVLVKSAICGILRERTKLSLSNIGSVIKKDHATVIHLFKKYKSLITTNQEYCNIYNKVYNIFSEYSA